MRIDAVVVDDVPLGVDTPHDLDRAREIIAARASDPKVASTFGSDPMPLL
jgi:3-deoxy-manno-octulosonate cytidylyltransferase (CMP-KDO synthetase)